MTKESVPAQAMQEWKIAVLSASFAPRFGCSVICNSTVLAIDAMLSKPRAPVADITPADLLKAATTCAKKRGPYDALWQFDDLGLSIFVSRIRGLQAALASAPVAGSIQWPTMPPSKGQSPILFEDGYAEGWAKCIDECKRAVSAASAPVAGEAQTVCKTCGGSKVDPGGLPVCRDCGAAPQASEVWRNLAATVYQACGAYNMPAKVLDLLSAAASGERFDHMIDGILPIEGPEK